MAKALVIKCDTCKKEIEAKDGQISIIVGDDSIQCEPCNVKAQFMKNAETFIDLIPNLYDAEREKDDPTVTEHIKLNERVLNLKDPYAVYSTSALKKDEKEDK